MIEMKLTLALGQCILLTLVLALIGMKNSLGIGRTHFNPSLQVATKQQPPVSDRPPERVPGSTRGSCEQTDRPFTPLLPFTNFEFSGLTLSEHPSFWFYIPYKDTNITSGDFLLEDSDNNQVYQIVFKLPKTPGFVKVSVPITGKGLDKNKLYYWTFTLYCISQDPSESPSVFYSGTVQRADMPTLETQLKATTLEERLRLYIENSIWYDVSTDLAQIHNQRQLWINLLRSFGLEQLSKEPIAGSVLPIEE